MLKTIIRKLERKKLMTWMLMWLNWSIAIINVVLQFIYIYIYIYAKNEIVTIQIRYSKSNRLSTSKSIVDEKDILKYFIAFDIARCGPV